MNIARAHFYTHCAKVCLNVCVDTKCVEYDTQKNMWSLPFVLAERKAVWRVKWLTLIWKVCRYFIKRAITILSEALFVREGGAVLNFPEPAAIVQWFNKWTPRASLQYTSINQHTKKWYDVWTVQLETTRTVYIKSNVTYQWKEKKRVYLWKRSTGKWL